MSLSQLFFSQLPWESFDYSSFSALSNLFCCRFFEMKSLFEPNALLSWIETAQWADLSYHRTRRDLLSALSKLARRPGNGADGYFRLPDNAYLTLISTLSIRNDGLDNNARLAFTTLLLDLAEQVNTHLEQAEQLAGAGEDEREQA